MTGPRAVTRDDEDYARIRASSGSDVVSVVSLIKACLLDCERRKINPRPSGPDLLDLARERTRAGRDRFNGVERKFALEAVRFDGHPIEPLEHAEEPPWRLAAAAELQEARERWQAQCKAQRAARGPDDPPPVPTYAWAPGVGAAEPEAGEGQRRQLTYAERCRRAWVIARRLALDQDE